MTPSPRGRPMRERAREREEQPPETKLAQVSRQIWEENNALRAHAAALEEENKRLKSDLAVLPEDERDRITLVRAIFTLRAEAEAKDALVGRMAAALRRYRAHANNGVVDHRLDGVDEDADALLADLDATR